MQWNFCGRSTLLKIYDILSWGYVLMKWWRPYESCQESCFDANVRRHCGSWSRIGSLNGPVVRHTSLPSQINNNRVRRKFIIYYKLKIWIKKITFNLCCFSTLKVEVSILHWKPWRHQMPDMYLESGGGGHSRVMDYVYIYGLIWIDVEDKIIVLGKVNKAIFLFLFVFSTQTTHLLSVYSIFSAAAGY